MNRSIAAAAAVLALAGCASLNVLDAEVSSFSRWPAGRAPATYAFERLPSQQANPQAAEVLEDSARRAVEAAGFVPAGEGAAPDVSVQIGARITATDRSPFDDPFWYGPYGWGPTTGRSSTAATAAATGDRMRARTGAPTGATAPGVRATTTSPYYEREVAVLIRDKKSGEPLYEARANSEGTHVRRDQPAAGDVQRRAAGLSRTAGRAIRAGSRVDTTTATPVQ